MAQQPPLPTLSPLREDRREGEREGRLAAHPPLRNSSPPKERVVIAPGSGVAWPRPLCCYHFNRNSIIAIRCFLAEPCRTFNNLIFLIISCVLYLFLYLTKRPALAPALAKRGERTCSCGFQELVRLRSEGPKPDPAFAPRAMSAGGFPARWVCERGCS